ncbi:hypothetical protein SUGI_1074560 [Cryptomeria japonica]|nr:hypothetical protein SUGI_1074560 [Cryptomeria japonica]
MRINCFSPVVKEKRRRVKIMTANGEVIKVWSPVSVKETLADYPDHEMFEADQSSRLSMHSRPLSLTTLLRPGRLYFLIPLPMQSTPSSTSSQTTRPQICSKPVSDKDLRTDDIKSRLISSTNNGSTTRLRIRLSKEEASSLLSVDGEKLMGDLLASFIQQEVKNREQNSWESVLPRWKPGLETILEQLSPIFYESGH